VPYTVNSCAYLMLVSSEENCLTNVEILFKKRKDRVFLFAFVFVIMLEPYYGVFTLFAHAGLGFSRPYAFWLNVWI